MKKLIRNIQQSLFLKSAILLSLFAIVPISLLSIFLFGKIEKNFTDQIFKDQKEITKGYSREVAQIVNSPVEILRSFSGILGSLFSDPDRQELILLNLTMEFPAISEIITFDLSRNFFASSFPGEYSEESDFSSWRGFNAAWQGKEFVSEVYLNQEYIPTIDIALPLKRMGSISGVLMAKINLSQMWEIIDSVKIGKTGLAYLTTKDGTIIAHWDKKKILKNEKIVPASNVQRENYFFSLLKGGGNETIVYTSAIPELGWTFGVVQKASEVYRFQYLTLIFVGGLICALLFISVIVSFRIAKIWTKPIEEISQASRKVGRGQYDVHLRPRSNDALGHLTISFNNMVKKLKRAKEEEKVTVFGYAAAFFAHKMKNALTSIKTFAQLFPKRKGDKVFVERMERELLQDINRVEELLNRFLSLNTTQEEENHFCNIVQCLRDVLGNLDHFFAHYNVQCFSEFPEEDVIIQGSVEDLQELFKNLITNALEAMPEGGKLNIDAFVQQGKGPRKLERFVIQLTDTGLGMDKEKLENLFVPFDSSKEHGTGIGLVFCRKVMQRLGGTIEIQSTLNKGTKVILTFPKFRVISSPLNSFKTFAAIADF